MKQTIREHLLKSGREAGGRISLLLIAVLFAGCANNLFYHPTHTTYLTPARNGYTYEDVTFSSGDGVQLHGWYIPAQPDEAAPAKGIVIHFHGNAQNMTAHYAYVAWLPLAGYDVFVFDYRGYGQSAGKPNRKGMYADSIAAINYVMQRNVEQHPVFIIGQSLGGAQAVTAVGRAQIQGISGMLLDSTFYSYQSAARSALARNVFTKMLSIATPLLVSDGLDPADWVSAISPTPVTFIHGTRDQVVPLAHSKALYARAQEPKDLWIVEGGQHTDALSRHRATYIPKILQFFAEAAEAAKL